VTWANSRRLACLCDDCQIYAHYLGRADVILDAHAGTDLSYATQARVEISKGRERLQAVRLRESGMLRVFAGCCRTPVAHVPSPQLAFVGIPHLFMRHGPGAASRDEILGPLVHRLQGKFGRGELPEGTYPGTPAKLWVKAMFSVLWDSACGRQRPSAFHDAATNTPLVRPTVLRSAELEALYAQLGPRGARQLQSGVTVGCS
jgi:hypothetical protein